MITVNKLSVMSACVGMCAAGSLAGVVFDTFDADPGSAGLGDREYGSSITSDPFGQGGNFTLDTAFASGADTGAMFFNSGIGAEQSAWISYSNAGSGLDLDAGSMGLTHFELDFLLADQDSFVTIVLSTYDEFGASIGETMLDVLVPAGAGTTASWAMADFTESFGSFDASNIDEISISFNGGQSPTASLDFVATEFRGVVPTPGTLALLGLGSICSIRRKR